MLIANPIYDAVFKYLMEDAEIARRLLSAIIGEEITEIEVQPQEQTTFSERFSILLYRLDFKATIRLQTGEQKKILIELQKAKDPIDIIRFRRYLGENYHKEDRVRNAQGLLEKQSLPIITIYILGFELPKVQASVLKVNRVYKDLVNDQILEVKEDFIEQLTHDSFVIQIPRLQTRMQNRIERILAVFNQSYVTQDTALLNLPSELIEEELIQLMAKRLAKATESEKVRQQIELEESFELSLERALREKDKQIEQLLTEKEEQIEALRQQLEAERQKNKQRP
jgi:hypothetical protein